MPISLKLIMRMKNKERKISNLKNKKEVLNIYKKKKRTIKLINQNVEKVTEEEKKRKRMRNLGLRSRGG